MTFIDTIFLIHCLLSILVAFAFCIDAIALLTIGLRFSRKLKLNDKEAWLALGGGHSHFLFWNSTFTIFYRLKAVIPELDEKLAADAKVYLKMMKIGFWLLPIFVVLVLLGDLY